MNVTDWNKPGYFEYWLYQQLASLRASRTAGLPVINGYHASRMYMDRVAELVD